MNRHIILFKIFILALSFFSCTTLPLRYKKIREKDNIDSYENFLKKYPQSDFSDSIKSRIEELRYQKSTTIDSLEKFIEDYPNSLFLEKAKKQIGIIIANDKLQKLMIERYKTLQETLQFLKKGYEKGAVSFSDVRYTTIDLLKADLYFCKTNSEKVEIYEKIFAQTKEIEELTKTLYDVGRVSKSGLLGAKALRLEAEIALIKQKIFVQDNIKLDLEK